MNTKEINENSLPTDSQSNCIIINTNFSINDLKNANTIHKNDKYILKTINLVKKCTSLLEYGALLFVYGLPKYLPYIGDYLNNRTDFLFKYWIALEFEPIQNLQILPNSHIGLLMYLKTKSLTSPTPFKLNTKTVRVPYSTCPACGNITKDWGGKKHLMNPLGSALSDVWVYPDINISDYEKIPIKIVKRIYDLLDETKNKLLIVYQDDKSKPSTLKTRNKKNKKIEIQSAIENKVIQTDSIEFMKKLSEEYPNGIFDLAFADPPYNLYKNYNTYNDERSDQKYIQWCNKWLEGMSMVLKPGGALFVLNLPKWAIYHSIFLSKIMEFRHWIVWDALASPAGKFLPAHYALLYYSKPGSKPKSNFDKNKYIESRKYCIRNSCIKNRKYIGDNDKELLSDIWKDIHRIKHKKDRDHHPCQLPTNLMKRIIELFTYEGDIVYDPFGGAGTTAIAAKLSNRKYVITDIDEHYINVAENNLKRVIPDILGQYEYKRESVSRKTKNNGVAKKLVETSYLTLCFKESKILSMEEVKKLDEEIYNLLQKYAGRFRKLKNVCKRKFEAYSLIK